EILHRIQRSAETDNVVAWRIRGRIQAEMKFKKYALLKVRKLSLTIRFFRFFSKVSSIISSIFFLEKIANSEIISSSEKASAP
ncbi:MAG: hypothetical protein ACYCSA_10745, partial [Thermoplasmataceae archaeon]